MLVSMNFTTVLFRSTASPYSTLGLPTERYAVRSEISACRNPSYYHNQDEVIRPMNGFLLVRMHGRGETVMALQVGIK